MLRSNPKPFNSLIFALAARGRSNQNAPMAVLGEAALDADGVLHGWCWNPAHPAERRAIEILIDGRTAAMLVASRFREDLRFRKYGDGYHGFSVTLTRHIAMASRHSVLSARDRETGFTFWQKGFGEFAIPEDLDTRLDRLRASTSAGARSSGFAHSGDKTARLSNAFSQLSGILQARAGKPAPQAPQPAFALPRLASPALSVILDASGDATALELIRQLRLSVPALHRAGAEVILADDGVDSQTAKLQTQAQNLRYILSPGATLAARRNASAAVARGNTLVFIKPGQGGLLGLSETPPERIVVSGAIAGAIRRTAPSFAGSITPLPSAAPPGFMLAMPRGLIQTYGKFDTTVDDDNGLDILDWVLRAASNGAEITAWRGSESPIAPAPSPDIAAGRRFAERWIMGAAAPALA